MLEKVEGEAPQPPRLHPEPGSPRFIPRLGHRQERLAPILRDEGVTVTVSPIYYMAHNPELALFPFLDPPMGLALDPSTHLRQLPYDSRAPAFRALPYGGSRLPYSAEAPVVDTPTFVSLVTQPLDLARARGATLMLTAYHLAGGIGTAGRTIELELARASIDHFRAQRMDEPPEHSQVPVVRQIYATLAVPVEALERPPDRARLAEAYLNLESDGFWVKIAGFSEKARHAKITAGAAFLSILARSGRPVVADGAGHLHVGLLAHGISTSIGMAEAERFDVPRERSDRGNGRLRPIFHPKYLKSFLAGGDGATRARNASGCRCGRHPAGTPPTGGAIEEHAAVVRVREAREALRCDADQRREWLLANAAMASHLAHDAGVDFTPSSVFEALLEGMEGDQPQDLVDTG